MEQEAHLLSAVRSDDDSRRAERLGLLVVRLGTRHLRAAERVRARNVQAHAVVKVLARARAGSPWDLRGISMVVHAAMDVY